MREFYISDEVSDYLAKNRPSVAILAPSLDTIPSRLGNAIYCLIEDIAYNSSHPVIVFSKSGEGLPESKIDDRIIYYKKALRKTLFQRIIGHRGRKTIYGISRTEDIIYARKVYNFCKKNGIKCLIVEDSNSLLAGIPGKPEINIILHQHADSLTLLSDKFFYKFTAKLKHIVFVSEKNKIKTCNRFPAIIPSVSTIYNGIDLSKFRNLPTDQISMLKKALSLSEKTLVFLFSGRIYHSKGIYELLQTAKCLKDIDIHILVAGDLKTNYDYNTGFESRIKDLVDEKVTLLGSVSQDKISDYYSLCDFVIVPSIGAEGLPKVISEAIVMGKPVIASDRGGITELITDGENGIIIEEPVCQANIANAIARAIKCRESLTKNAEENMNINRERFSSESMAKQFDAIFSKFV